MGRSTLRSRTSGLRPTVKLACAAGLFLALGVPGRIEGNPTHQLSLSFEERVTARRRVEEVLWRHRLWPEDNQGPKPPLEAVLDDRTLRESVRDVLRKSSALESLFNRPITSNQLQTELDRMLAESQDRAMLREMLDALDSDPLLAAEILARPLLADRLLRSSYASDDRFHGEIRRRARAVLAREPGADDLRRLADRYEERTLVLELSPAASTHRPGPGTRFLDPPDWDDYVRRLAARWSAQPAAADACRGDGRKDAILAALPAGRVSSLAEDEDSLSVVILLEKSPGLLRFGAASWVKTPFDTWWAQARAGQSDSATTDGGPYLLPDSAPSSSCTDDAWTPTGGTPPSPRRYFTMIWTGAEAIVWGGDAFGTLDTGGRYDPATASWTPTSTSGAPVARSDHSAVWTGTQMIIWAGTESGGGGPTGGRYNPASNTWSATSTINQAAARGGHTAVWTGSQMLVWGGVGAMGIPIASGGRYNPSTDTWTTMSGAPLAGRWLHSSVWTGTDMIVIGGRDAPGPALPFYDGGIYNPATDSWAQIFLPIQARRSHTAVWDGGSMIVWGGDNNHGIAYGNGARWFPAGGSWTLVSTAGQPTRTQHVAVWTGDEMIVWSGWPGVPNMTNNTGARYRPDIDSWVGTTTTGAPAARTDHQAVWVGTRMMVWGGQSGGGAIYDTGGIYCACRNWTVDGDGDGHGVAGGTPTTTCDGTRPPGLFPQGDCNDANPAIHPGAYDGNCNAIDEDCDAIADDDYVSSSHGCGLGVCAATGLITCSGGTLVDNCVPGPQEELLDVTCNARDGDCDGAVDEDFVPIQEHWAPIAPSPAAVSGLTAVWSGSELLVWGGNENGDLLDFGQRYSPASGTWGIFFDPFGLQGREGHSAVWTGSSMMIWGGVDFQQIHLGDGGEYLPGSDQWYPIDNTGAPTPRSGHTAVWTGSTMIVWGGVDDTTFLRSGGIYEPTSPLWGRTRLTGAPVARAYHTAVWTGTRMVVWGGLGGTPGSPVRLATGGRYDPDTDLWVSTSTTGAPSARSGHTAIWTGTQMIVWGGTGVSGPLGDGARYDPVANTWSPVSSFGAPPAARSGHTAVWTGTEMWVWGGVGASGPLADGARYDPAADIWSPIIPDGAPSERMGASAVWTGSEMIVWAGNDGGALPTGGRYSLQTICGVGPCQAVGQTYCSGGVVTFACIPGTPSPEVCDGVDNDCDDVVDNNVPVPGGNLSMSASWDPTVGFGLSWSPIPNAMFYDMVAGAVSTLHATGGDFSLSTFGCVLDDYSSTSVNFGLIGDNYWFLLRAVNGCSGNGTYDGPGAGQVGARDPEMLADCP